MRKLVHMLLDKTTQEKAKEIEIETNKLLIKISEKVPDELKDEPVNWADLKCIDVYAGIQKTSPEYEPEICYCVVIDEVSSNAHKFKDYVRDNLEKRFKNNLSIITEY